MTSTVKICGITGPDALAAALAAGADMVGFVCFAPSPRHLGLGPARELSAEARGRVSRVLLVVDPTDSDLDEAVSAIEPELIQLHGAETPDRAAAIAGRFGRPVMKAIGIRIAADLAAAESYRGAAERILLDAKAPRGASRPGGNGAAFDWRLLAERDLTVGPDRSGRLVLSGGLTPENVAEAVRLTGLSAVDVSSGVESAPGRKDPARIRAFVRAARAAFADGAPGSKGER